jgi:hypothetical protein
MFFLLVKTETVKKSFRLGRGFARRNFSSS